MDDFNKRTAVRRGQPGTREPAVLTLRRKQDDPRAGMPATAVSDTGRRKPSLILGNATVPA